MSNLIKSQDVQISTDGYGRFSSSVDSGYIIGLKESSGGIISYSYYQNPNRIIGFLYNWSGNVVPSKSFNITIYYIDN